MFKEISIIENIDIIPDEKFFSKKIFNEKCCFSAANFMSEFSKGSCWIGSS